MPESEVIRTARILKAEARRYDDIWMRGMQRQWMQVERNLKEDIEDFAEVAHQRAQEGRIVPITEAYRFKEFTDLLLAVQYETTRFGDRAVEVLAKERMAMVELGIDHGIEILKATDRKLPHHPDPDDVVESIVATYDAAPILKERLNIFVTMSPSIAEELLKMAVIGIATDWAIKKIINKIQDIMSGGLQKAMTIARNERTLAYRTAQSAVIETVPALTGVMRVCSHENTCIACLADEGRIYPPDEGIDDHPNGMCVGVPVFEGEAPPDIFGGEEWFLSQDLDFQEDMLGPTAFKAYREGRVTLSDFISHKESDQFGRIIQRKSLTELGLREAKHEALPFEGAAPKTPFPEPPKWPSSPNPKVGEWVDYWTTSPHSGQVFLNSGEMLEMKPTSVLLKTKNGTKEVDFADLVGWKQYGKPAQPEGFEFFTEAGFINTKIVASNQILEGQIEEMLVTMPKSMLSQVSVIRHHQDPDEWQKTLAAMFPNKTAVERLKIHAFYDAAPGYIELGPQASADMVRHELGHVLAKAAPQSLVDDFYNKWLLDESFDRHTRYAMESPQEALAESFRSYQAWVQGGRGDLPLMVAQTFAKIDKMLESFPDVLFAGGKSAAVVPVVPKVVPKAIVDWKLTAPSVVGEDAVKLYIQAELKDVQVGDVIAFTSKKGKPVEGVVTVVQKNKWISVTDEATGKVEWVKPGMPITKVASVPLTSEVSITDLTLLKLGDKVSFTDPKTLAKVSGKVTIVQKNKWVAVEDAAGKQTWIAPKKMPGDLKVQTSGGVYEPVTPMGTITWAKEVPHKLDYLDYGVGDKVTWKDEFGITRAGVVMEDATTGAGWVRVLDIDGSDVSVYVDNILTVAKPLSQFEERGIVMAGDSVRVPARYGEKPNVGVVHDVLPDGRLVVRYPGNKFEVVDPSEVTKVKALAKGEIGPLEVPDGLGPEAGFSPAGGSMKHPAEDFFFGSGRVPAVEGFATKPPPVQFKASVEVRLKEKMVDYRASLSQAEKFEFDLAAQRLGLRCGTSSAGGLPRELVSTWARTSRDDSVIAIAFQRAVQDTFGIADDSWRSLVSSGTLRASDKFYAETKAYLNAYVRAMYDLTQQDLADAGFEYLLLWRGSRQAAGGGVRAVDCMLQPASAFSSNIGTAKSFASGWGGSGKDTLYFVKVPASRILSTPRSGCGCLNERELVVLGGEGKMLEIPNGGSFGAARIAGMLRKYYESRQ